MIIFSNSKKLNLSKNKVKSLEVCKINLFFNNLQVQIDLEIISQLYIQCIDGKPQSINKKNLK